LTPDPSDQGAEQADLPFRSADAVTLNYGCIQDGPDYHAKPIPPRKADCIVMMSRKRPSLANGPVRTYTHSFNMSARSSFGIPVKFCRGDQFQLDALEWGGAVFCSTTRNRHRG